MLHSEYRSIFYRGIIFDSVSRPSFSLWVKDVLADGYKVKNEFMEIGVLPEKVMNFPAVHAKNHTGLIISISDNQIKHLRRDSKILSGASLDIDDVEKLPNKLLQAKWFFDVTKAGLIALIQVNNSGKVGKVAIHLNFVRSGAYYNAVVTAGLINPSNINDARYVEIK